jgi:hypothetical protein
MSFEMAQLMYDNLLPDEEDDQALFEMECAWESKI